MKLSLRAGALAVAVAAGAALIAPLALPASAASLVSHVTCAKVASPKVTPGKTTSSTFATCTPVAFKLGGAGGTTKTPPAGSASGSVGFKVTWKGGMGTTTAAITFKPAAGIGKCPKTGGFTRLTIKGTVKVVTGKAKSTIKVGEPVTASQCVVVSGANAGKSQLETGTKFKL
jgi:hypothetical protein